ncbi:MAG: hypothetical protein SFY67_14840 [Candidatus Melainabacteria bacterium]|nr:hypothetical protein [Candidatus Melainabacteria bacterium]
MSTPGGMAIGFLLVFALSGFFLAKKKKLILFLQINAVLLALHLFLNSKNILLLTDYEMVLTVVSGWLFAMAGYFQAEIISLKDTVLKQKEELKIRMEQLHDFQLNIIRDDELERRALAGDLHDQILNDLKELKDNLDQKSKTELIDKIDQTSRNIREVMDNLSPTVLENLGLLASIEDCLRKGAEDANYKLRVKFLVDKSVFDKFSLIEQTLVYRIVQELKNNICRHAKAEKVRISVRQENAQIKIIIEDDGVGLKSQDNQNNPSRGMLYIKQRASIIGASVHWRPSESKGCIVEIFLPEKK